MGQRTQMLVRVNALDNDGNKVSSANIFHYQWGGYSARMFLDIIGIDALVAGNTLSSAFSRFELKGGLINKIYSELEKNKSNLYYVSNIMSELIKKHLELQGTCSCVSDEYENITEIENAEYIKGDYNDGLIAIDIDLSCGADIDINQSSTRLSCFTNDETISDSLYYSLCGEIGRYGTDFLYLKEVGFKELASRWIIDTKENPEKNKAIELFESFENTLDGKSDVKCFSSEYRQKLLDFIAEKAKGKDLTELVEKQREKSLNEIKADTAKNYKIELDCAFYKACLILGALLSNGIVSKDEILKLVIL